MSSSKFMNGTSLLMGDNTVPGLQIPDELKKLMPDIFNACKDFGLDFYPTVIQMLTYDEISEIAAYGGFPVRYPHWKWGMEYEELQRGYEYGMHRIYEMVLRQ
jgi:stage V sporulation protein R